MKHIKKLTRKIILGFVALMVIGAPLTYLTFLNSPTVKASWYDDNWAYRKAINIATHTASENSVYINLTGANDIDTSDTSRFQTDCGDLRFTDANGNLLKYYIASGCSSADTVVHVLFSTMPAGAQTVYYYYGNPTVANGGNAADFATEASNYTFTTIGSEEKAPSPVAYWKFDEGTGTNAQDATTNNNDGTISGATWQTEDQCISGKCLFFDGTNDYVDFGTSTTIKTTSFTTSFWFKTTNTSSQIAISSVKWGNFYGWVVRPGVNSGKILTQVQSAAATANNEITVTYADGNWHHYALIYDSSTNQFDVWFDGRVFTSTTTTDIAYESDANVYAGWAEDGASSPTGLSFKGFMDEIKIYPYARTTSQIQTDYASRGSVKGTSASLGSPSAGSGQLSQGLIGYWKMDEASGNLTDSSGNSNTGTVTGTTVASGKFGNGRTLNGTTDYANVGDPSSGAVDFVAGQDFTYSFWMKRSANTSSVFVLAKGAGNTADTGYAFVMGGGTTPRLILSKSGEASRLTIDGTNITDTNWHQITVVHNRTSNGIIYVDGAVSGSGDISGYNVSLANSQNLAIGCFSTGTTCFPGTLDEVRIYNRALSPAEISQLYNFAPGPRVHLKMDENSGTSANDSSGNARTGTINGNPIWAPGKYGAGVKMDGTGDDIQVGDF